MNRLKWLVAGLALAGIAHAGEPAATAYEMAIVDLQGQKKVLGTLPDSVFAPRVSPDGRKVAFEMTVPGENASDPALTRIHVAPLDDISKAQALQITVITGRNIAPVWTPEGDRIAFLATGNGPDALFWQRADGGEQPRFVVEGRAPEGIYPDGRMVFITLGANRDYGISAIDLDSKEVTKLIDLPGSEQHSSRISPDGRWIVYTSNETGRYELWAEPMPQDGQRFQLTRDGGGHAVWAPDSQAVYFDRGGSLHRLDLRVEGNALRAGATTKLPISGFQQIPLRRQFDIVPDGSGFVMLFPVRATQ